MSAVKILETLISEVSNKTLQSLFESIYRETGLLTFSMEHPDKRRMLEILTSFFDFIKEETRRQPMLSLQDLVTHLELMEKEGIALPLIEVNGSAESVNLLTVHGSKGLEFTHVFFAGCNSHNWEKKKKPGSGFHFPDTLFQSVPNDEGRIAQAFLCGGYPGRNTFIYILQPVSKQWKRSRTFRIHRRNPGRF